MSYHPYDCVSPLGRKLYDALKNGDLKSLKEILASGADFNNGGDPTCVKTPLMIAVDSGNVEGLRMLVEAGWLYNSAFGCLGQTPLTDAAKGGKLEMVKILVESGVSVNNPNINGSTALHGAAQFSNLEIAAYLLENEADVNAQDCNGFTALTIAVTKQFTKMTKLLIEHKADVNLATRNQQSCLMLSIKGNVNLARMLLDSGADINHQDCEGEAPLFKVITANRNDMLDLLLEYKADINLPDNQGFTPLMFCISQGNAEMFDILLKAGADIHAVTLGGETALYLAVDEWVNDEEFEEGIIHSLLEAGSDPNTTPDDKIPPLHLTVNILQDVSYKLIEHGSKPTLATIYINGKNDKNSNVLACPLYLSFWFTNFKLCQFMINVMCYDRASFRSTKALNELRWRLNKQPDNGCIKLLNEFLSSPPRLLAIARRCISSAIGFGPTRKNKVATLPIPATQKNNILLG